MSENINGGRKHLLPEKKTANSRKRYIILIGRLREQAPHLSKYDE